MSFRLDHLNQNSFGVQMRLRHLGQLLVVLACTVACVSCGQVYRPVVIPITITPPNPSNFHEVFAVNANVPFNPGTGMQVDVSGDTNAGVINIGLNPTHAGILPNNTRVFVASAGSVSGQSDVVTSFTPAFNAAVAGRDDRDLLSAGRLRVFLAGGIAKSRDYELSLIGDPWLQAVSPIAWLGHAALHG